MKQLPFFLHYPDFVINTLSSQGWTQRIPNMSVEFPLSLMAWKACICWTSGNLMCYLSDFTYQFIQSSLTNLCPDKNKTESFHNSLKLPVAVNAALFQMSNPYSLLLNRSLLHCITPALYYTTLNHVHCPSPHEYAPKECNFRCCRALELASALMELIL